jgi:hypothetical protein
MHTAICAFDDRARAEEARDALLRSGFARHDVHIEHKDLYGQGAGGLDIEHMEEGVGMRGVLSSYGHFFASLLGMDDPSGRVDTYAQHVERGGYVVVVDADDETEADRARTMMQGLEARDVNTMHRPAQRPLRDIVGMRQAGVSDGTAGMVERSREPYEGWTPSVSSNMEGGSGRAMASHTLSPTSGPDLREPEIDHAPGLRYADKDKPNG